MKMRIKGELSPIGRNGSGHCRTTEGKEWRGRVWVRDFRYAGEPQPPVLIDQTQGVLDKGVDA